MVMTSPPYWSLRDYGVPGQMGLERTFEEYIEKFIDVAKQLMRVLKPTGSMYLNLGDTYARRQCQGTSSRRKSLIGLPWRIALRLLDEGWLLRSDIIWHKTNGLPSSVKDRLSNRYEHLFHFVKSERYYYNLEAIREPYRPSSFKRFRGLVSQGMIKHKSKYNALNLPDGVQFSKGKTPVPNWLGDLARQHPEGTGLALNKAQMLHLQSRGRTWHGHNGDGKYVGIHSSSFGKNPGDVWSLASSSYRGAHFAVYPEKLCVRPILSSCPPRVCSRCGSPKREVVMWAGPVGASFNIRVRDAQAGRLEGKWGGHVAATEEEIVQYDDHSYRPVAGERIIAEGCSCNTEFQPGVVLDPFAGSGTTMRVALSLGRSAIGIELNPDYASLIRERVTQLTEMDICQTERGS